MARWVEEIPARWARERGEATVLACARSRHAWRELEAARIEWAQRLAGLGVRPGDRVMVVGENCPAMAMLVFALTTVRA